MILIRYSCRACRQTKERAPKRLIAWQKSEHEYNFHYMYYTSNYNATNVHVHQSAYICVYSCYDISHSVCRFLGILLNSCYIFFALCFRVLGVCMLIQWIMALVFCGMNNVGAITSSMIVVAFHYDCGLKL